MASISSTQVVMTNVWKLRLIAMLSGLRRAPKIPTVILGILLAFGLFGQWLAPHDPIAIDLAKSFTPPVWHAEGSASNLLGTDKLGRDILSRVIIGSRVSLALSLTIIGLGGGVGVILGLISGYSGRKVDSLIQRGVEVILAMPTILVALVFVFTVGRSFESVMFILSPFLAARFTRIVRGETLSIRERDFVAVAKVIGTPAWMILLRHILPNVFNTVIVLATLEVGHLILLEASLSFLGVGVPPPHPAWGLMVAGGREFISSAYWIALFPGLAILFAVLSINLFGDWLRDTLDPRRRQL
ncbi:MAG: ABC transporter permease [Dehalococcoidia bacterium]|jgi:peptide/nickel transport system permease protein|nr:ABC transporter permease [Dehalococcoidia bacterium]